MNSRLDKLTPGLPAKLNLLFDLLLVVLAVHLATGHAVPWPVDPQVVSLSSVACGAWILGAAVLRLYSPATPRTTLDQVALSLLLVAGLTTVLYVWQRLLPDDGGHFSPLAFGGVAFCWTTASRFLLFRPLSRLADDPEEVLIVGTGREGRALYERLQNAEEGKKRVKGFVRFCDEQPDSELPAALLGAADGILDVLSEHPVDEVYIAGRLVDHGAEMQKVVDACEEVGMPFALPVHALSFQRARLLTAPPSDDGYLHYLSTETKPAQYAIKRLVDIVCSATALVVLSPLLLTVAAIIKITSPGPVLFKQVRVGLHGNKFNLLKFRSMVVDADAMKDKLLDKNEQTGPVFKMKNDPRVTPIGRFIRKYSIDELPQLVNILRGDMTIVGPRPAVPKEVAQYKAWQRRRLSVRPGLTCYWQVSGRNEIGFEQWMHLDLRYVDNWSLALDAELILRTFPVVLLGKGAS